MRHSAIAQITRRPASKQDLEMIYRILRASLGPYIEQTWGKLDDLAQRKRFDEVTRVEDHSIVELQRRPIGCLCFGQSDVEFRLIRLLIRPEFQRLGLGTQILKEVLALADDRRLPVRLRVLRVNPARRLYERHGFLVVSEDETHYTMIRPV